MPGGDRTGPLGFGPMTGRARGYCAGQGVPGFANPSPFRWTGLGWGYGFGRGMGLGRGARWSMRGAAFPIPPMYDTSFQRQPEDEKRFLENQMLMLQNQIKEVQHRLDSLSAKEKDKTS